MLVKCLALFFGCGIVAALGVMMPFGLWLWFAGPCFFLALWISIYVAEKLAWVHVLPSSLLERLIAAGVLVMLLPGAMFGGFIFSYLEQLLLEPFDFNEIMRRHTYASMLVGFAGMGLAEALLLVCAMLLLTKRSEPRSVIAVLMAGVIGCPLSYSVSGVVYGNTGHQTTGAWSFWWPTYFAYAFALPLFNMACGYWVFQASQQHAKDPVRMPRG